MGINPLKEELIKIEEAVKMNQLDNMVQLLNTSLDLSVSAEQALKEMLDQL